MLKTVHKLSLLEKKNLLEKMVKLQEEVGELAQEVLILLQSPGTKYKTKKEKALLEESIDVVLVALSIFFSEGGTVKQYQSLMEEKMKKWKLFQKK